MLKLTDQNFKTEVMKSALPVFVDFWAPWCGPCRMAEPVIEELDKKYDGKIVIGKLNVDENPQIPQKYGVMSIPTAMIFKNGKEVKRLVGFPGKAGYEKLIREVLNE